MRIAPNKFWRAGFAMFCLLALPMTARGFDEPPPSPEAEDVELPAPAAKDPTRPSDQVDGARAARWRDQAADGASRDRRDTKLNQKELADLVKPIALYPDPILKLVFEAAGRPLAVHYAAKSIRGARTRSAGALENELPESVKRLREYPELLNQLAEHMEETIALGRAYRRQADDVWTAVDQVRDDTDRRKDDSAVAESTPANDVAPTNVVSSSNNIVYADYAPNYYGDTLTPCVLGPRVSLLFGWAVPPYWYYYPSGNYNPYWWWGYNAHPYPYFYPYAFYPRFYPALPPYAYAYYHPPGTTAVTQVVGPNGVTTIARTVTGATVAATNNLVAGRGSSFTTITGPDGVSTIARTGAGFRFNNGLSAAAGGASSNLFTGPNGNQALINRAGIAGATTVGNTTTFGAAGGSNIATSTGKTATTRGAITGSVTQNGNQTSFGTSATGSVHTNTGIDAAGSRTGSGNVTYNADGSIDTHRDVSKSSTTNSGSTNVTKTRDAHLAGPGQSSYAGSTAIDSTRGDVNLNTTAGNGQVTTTVDKPSGSKTYILGDGQITNRSSSSTAKSSGARYSRVSNEQLATANRELARQWGSATTSDAGGSAARDAALRGNTLDSGLLRSSARANANTSPRFSGDALGGAALRSSARDNFSGRTLSGPSFGGNLGGQASPSFSRPSFSGGGARGMGGGGGPRGGGGRRR